jgi:hypothetical protein
MVVRLRADLYLESPLQNTPIATSGVFSTYQSEGSTSHNGGMLRLKPGEDGATGTSHSLFASIKEAVNSLHYSPQSTFRRGQATQL